MTIHLQPQVEEELKRVARERGRDLQAIVDEAFDQYLTVSSITDVTSDQIGQTQEKLMSELTPQEDWIEGHSDETR